MGGGIEATEGEAAQSVDVNRGGAHWVRIVGRAVMLSKADGYQERQPQKEGVQ